MHGMGAYHKSCNGLVDVQMPDGEDRVGVMMLIRRKVSIYM